MSTSPASTENAIERAIEAARRRYPAAEVAVRNCAGGRSSSPARARWSA